MQDLIAMTFPDGGVDEDDEGANVRIKSSPKIFSIQLQQLIRWREVRVQD